MASIQIPNLLLPIVTDYIVRMQGGCTNRRSVSCSFQGCFLVACFTLLGFNRDVKAIEDGLANPKSDIQFNRDIRPILSDLCFTCHGPDEQHRQADLRLDTHAGVLHVVKAQDARGSELLRRMKSEDADEKMPPAKSPKQPTRLQMDLIQRWIDEGARWEDHWSFAPLLSPAIPEDSPLEKTLDSTRSKGRKNPIDAFVQHQLRARGWSQTHEADKRTMIRRVSLDLTGLPPSLREVSDFLEDSSPDAYEKVVDRLLRSESFGERMAWDWLDAARYADSNGYQGDNDRTMWPWRDWVVRAFNSNIPFNDFTVWQLAGDLIPNASADQKLATAFCRNHMINGEGGRIAEENRVDYVMDMTETVGTVWLGLTLNCCRCHDHKFDPIQQEEYYRLFAFFNQTPVDGKGGDPKTAPTMPVPSQKQQSALDSVDHEMNIAQDLRSKREKHLATTQPDWEQEFLVNQRGWAVARTESANAENQRLTVQENSFVLASGENTANDNYYVVIQPNSRIVAGIRLDVCQHPSMTKNGLSRAESGNFVLTSFELYRVHASFLANELQLEHKGRTNKIDLAEALATFEQGDHKATKTLDDDLASGWAVWQGKVVDRPHSIQFSFSEPISLSENERLLVVLRHQSTHGQHHIGYFRFATSDVPPSKDISDLELTAALQKHVSARSEFDRELITKRQKQSDIEFSALEKQINGLKDKRRAVTSKIPEVMIMAERKDPRDTFVLNRGLYNSTGKKIQSGVPASLPPIGSDASPNRLSLARWLVSEEQPLTPRVIVNRVWQQFFGIGLTKTVEDLGSQGEIPKFLDLHNWLAAEFRDNGWDMKHLIRLIVTSHTYKQSSRFSDSPFSSEDPENRYLARGPRFRMPSWMIRDQALAASGLMVRQLGGPSVNVYQPEGIWEEATFGKKKYQRDSGESLYRRSLYVFWRRIVGPTIFFDNAARQVCTVKTTRTNTPLQALYTLNDTTFVEAARAMAVSTLLIPNFNDEQRIDSIYQKLLARSVQSNELQVLLAALVRSRSQFNSNAKSSLALISVGESKNETEMDPMELASWTALCLAILNLDETLTKE